MNLQKIIIRNGVDQVQVVVDGLVNEVRWTGHTLSFATGSRYEVSKPIGHDLLQRPAPLMGEGELKQESLRRIIGEWETEVRRAQAAYIYSPMLSDTANKGWMDMRLAHSRLTEARRALAAVDEVWAHRMKPSPINTNSTPAG